MTIKEYIEKWLDVQPKKSPPKFIVGKRVKITRGNTEGTVIACYPPIYVIQLDDGKKFGVEGYEIQEIEKEEE